MSATISSLATGCSGRSKRRFSKYRAILRLIMGFVLAFLSFQISSTFADDGIESTVKDNLVTFEKLAVNICQSAPTKSSKEELSFSVSGKAELSKLIKIIAGIDAEVEVDIESDKATGVLQRDLAEVIIHSNNCRLEVLRIVIDFVKSHVGQEFPKLQNKNSNANDNVLKSDTREFRVNQIIKALDYMIIHDVADYLITVIPRIKDGITCSEMQVMMKKVYKFDRLNLVERLSDGIRRPLPDNCLSDLAALVSKYDAKKLLITLEDPTPAHSTPVLDRLRLDWSR